MRIVLDENLPRPLKRAFAAVHVVTTVQELGLAGLTNGALLAELETHWEVFVTADKNLRYQQNLAGRTLAIVELPTNRLPLLLPLFGRIAAVVESATPGAYIKMADETGDLSNGTSHP
jgi:PIN domain-containing protein